MIHNARFWDEQPDKIADEVVKIYLSVVDPFAGTGGDVFAFL